LEQTLADRLAASGIQLAAETPGYLLFTRDNCIALVQVCQGAPGSIGSTGLMTEHGLSYLVWRDGRAFLKSKTAEIVAGEDEIAAIERFSKDLANALQ